MVNFKLSELPTLDVSAIKARTDEIAREKAITIEGYRAAVRTNLKDVETLIGLGEALILSNPSESLTVLEQAAELAPDRAEIHTLLGLTHSFIKEKEEARNSFERALALDPNNARALMQVAFQLGAERKHAQALEIYRKVIEIEPENARYHYELAVSLVNNGQVPLALESLKTAQNLALNNAQIFNQIASVLGSLNRMDEAIAALKKAVELEPNNPEYWFSLAIMMVMEDFEKAEESLDILEKLTDVHPSPYLVHLYIAQIQEKLRKDKQAEASYKQSIKIDPSTIAHFSLSELYVRSDDFKNAYAHAIEALKLAGKNGNERISDIETCRVIGDKMKNAGLIEERILALKKLIELEPDHLGYYQHLGMALEFVGKLSEALEVMENLANLLRKSGKTPPRNLNEFIKDLRSRLPN